MLQGSITRGELLRQHPVQFDSQVVKINRKNDPQQRHLVITAGHLYNLKGEYVQRAISAEAIEAVVMSKSSYEFVLRVLDGYDYRFESPLRWRVYEEVIKLSEERGCSRLPLYLVQSATLEGYCRNSHGGGLQQLPPPVDFQFDSSLNRIISNLLQADHRVLFIADPHLFQIHPTELVEVIRLGHFTTLVEHHRSKDKLLRKVISKDGLVGSSFSMRRRFVQYQQSSHTEHVCFVLEDPDSFMVYTRPYRHSLAQDLQNFREFTEAEISSIFSQLITSMMILSLQELSLENVLYDELDELVLTEFEQLRPRSSHLHVEEMSPQQYATGRKSPVTVIWRIGVLLYRLVYGTGPTLSKPERFFTNKKLWFDEERRSRISTNLDTLIQQLLEFDPQKRMRRYCSNGQPCTPSDIIRHAWFG